MKWVEPYLSRLRSEAVFVARLVPCRLVLPHIPDSLLVVILGCLRKR
jgi:hypothetical protein